MKFKKSYGKNKVTKNVTSANDKVIISSEYYENVRPSFICSFCSQTLIRLTDAGLNNTAYWCRHCSVEFDPESENLRKESKITVPDRNQEGSITSIGVTPDISIRHKPEPKGAFKALQQRGLKIADYKEDVG
jgi:hypothetical protein